MFGFKKSIIIENSDKDRYLVCSNLNFPVELIQGVLKDFPEVDKGQENDLWKKLFDLCQEKVRSYPFIRLSEICTEFWSFGRYFSPENGYCFKLLPAILRKVGLWPSEADKYLNELKSPFGDCLPGFFYNLSQGRFLIEPALFQECIWRFFSDNSGSLDLNLDLKMLAEGLELDLEAKKPLRVMLAEEESQVAAVGLRLSKEMLKEVFLTDGILKFPYDFFNNLLNLKWLGIFLPRGPVKENLLALGFVPSADLRVDIVYPMACQLSSCNEDNFLKKVFFETAGISLVQQCYKDNSGYRSRLFNHRSISELGALFKTGESVNLSLVLNVMVKHLAGGNAHLKAFGALLFSNKVLASVLGGSFNGEYNKNHTVNSIRILNILIKESSFNKELARLILNESPFLDVNCPADAVMLKSEEILKQDLVCFLSNLIGIGAYLKKLEELASPSRNDCQEVGPKETGLFRRVVVVESFSNRQHGFIDDAEMFPL